MFSPETKVLVSGFLLLFSKRTESKAKDEVKTLILISSVELSVVIYVVQLSCSLFIHFL